MLHTLAFAAASAAASTRCYFDPVYQNASIRLISNVTFGSAFNNKTGEQQTLQLDGWYTVRFIHCSPRLPVTRHIAIPSLRTVRDPSGGGFVDGDKMCDSEAYMCQDPQLAMKFATRGFAAVSVNYRLTGGY